MRKELKDWVSSLLFEKPAKWETYLKKDSVQLMWQPHQSEQIDHSARLWEIVAFEMGNKI